SWPREWSLDRVLTLSALSEILVNGLPTDPIRPRQIRLGNPGVSLRDKLVCVFGSQRFLSALVDTLGLGNGDAFALPFANQFPLELRKRPEHGEHEPRGWVRAARKGKAVLHKLDRHSPFVE